VVAAQNEESRYSKTYLEAEKVGKAGRLQRRPWALLSQDIEHLVAMIAAVQSPYDTGLGNQPAGILFWVASPIQGEGH